MNVAPNNICSSKKNYMNEKIADITKILIEEHEQTSKEESETIQKI